jgi:hypothetical protein
MPKKKRRQGILRNRGSQVLSDLDRSSALCPRFNLALAERKNFHPITVGPIDAATPAIEEFPNHLPCLYARPMQLPIPFAAGIRGRQRLQ